MKYILIVLVLGLCMVKGFAQSDTTCPTAIFIPIDSADWCNTGMLTLSWTYCDEDYDGDLIPDDYWTADSVVWNMGDGQVETTYGVNPVTHVYNTGNFVQVSAVAYFTGQIGENCVVGLFVIYDINGASSDPCQWFYDSLPDPIISFDATYRITPLYANPGLYASPNSICHTDTISIFNSGELSPVPLDYTGWSYELLLDGQSVAASSGFPDDTSPIFDTLLETGDYTFEIINTFINGATPADTCSVSESILVTVIDCVDTCETCNSFKPIIGEKYWISAWVKEEHPAQVKTYPYSYIKLEFTGTPNEAQFQTSGDIIEGWQRIVGSFIIPPGTTDLAIRLVNNNSDSEVDAYFDDVRIHPFNASMKSYVYDPETLWLTAELDDNNYATFYEYDLEGQLIRIKKETARGIMTIQESRSNNPKAN